jgi:hypothetical protein
MFVFYQLPNVDVMQCRLNWLNNLHNIPVDTFYKGNGFIENIIRYAIMIHIYVYWFNESIFVL